VGKGVEVPVYGWLLLRRVCEIIGVSVTSLGCEKGYIDGIDFWQGLVAIFQNSGTELSLS
jgi:hypothetical protein